METTQDLETAAQQLTKRGISLGEVCMVCEITLTVVQTGLTAAHSGPTAAQTGLTIVQTGLTVAQTGLTHQ